VWATTAMLGTALRAVAGQGMAIAFVIMTCLFLALMLLGGARSPGASRSRPADFETP